MAAIDSTHLYISCFFRHKVGQMCCSETRNLDFASRNHNFEMYEVCHKSYKTEIAKFFFNLFKGLYIVPFKVVPLEFNKLFYSAFPRINVLWINSWGIPRSSFVTAFLMALVLKKRVPLMMFLTLGKRKKSHGTRSGE